MDREIKFRAWDIKNQVMRKVITRIDWLISGKPIRVYWMESEIETGVLKNEADCVGGVDEFILIEYTGLKDKNGVEIYEGDIVNTFNRWTHQVGFGDWQSHMSGETNIAFYIRSISDNIQRSLSDGLDIKIIGNIHENPELLNG